MEFLTSIYHNRRVVLNLIKHDFKNRYLGSHLGIVWAFVQPVVMISIYWFVFNFGLKAGKVDNTVPFLVWLMCGLVPWFFINDAIMSSAQAITSQAFLVKKIVFNVKLLPVVKIGSASLVSIIFWGLLIICLLGFGFFPDWYWLSAFYFIFCALFLSMAFGLLLSSITVFAQDVSQVLGIFLQVMFWATPIFWNPSVLHGNLIWIINLNPFAYIVNGMRDSLIYHVPFWGHYKNGFYFWGFTLLLFYFGNRIFNKLRPHFADVI